MVVSLDRTNSILEHLAAHFADHERGQRFREAFLNAQIARERLTPGGATANGLNKGPPSGLRPVYTCVDCSEKYSREDRDGHAEESKHKFCRTRRRVEV